MVLETCRPDSRIAIAVPTILLVTLSAAGPARAQGSVDLDASLRCFEEAGAPLANQNQCPSGATPVDRIILEPELFAPNVAPALLDRLANMALNAEDPLIRGGALAKLREAGLLEDGGVPRHPNVVERLERIFFSSEDPVIRGSSAGGLRYLADRERVIEFLWRVAAEPDAPDRYQEFPASYRAIESLWRLGERALVIELLERGAIASPEARGQARRLIEGTAGSMSPPG